MEGEVGGGQERVGFCGLLFACRLLVGVCCYCWPDHLNTGFAVYICVLRLGSAWGCLYVRPCSFYKRNGSDITSLAGVSICFAGSMRDSKTMYSGCQIHRAGNVNIERTCSGWNDVHSSEHAFGLDGHDLRRQPRSLHQPGAELPTARPIRHNHHL